MTQDMVMQTMIWGNTMMSVCLASRSMHYLTDTTCRHMHMSWTNQSSRMMETLSGNCSLHSNSQVSLGVLASQVGYGQPICTILTVRWGDIWRIMKNCHKQVTEWWKSCWKLLDAVVRKTPCLHFINLDFWQVCDLVVVKEVPWKWLDREHHLFWNGFQTVMSEIQILQAVFKLHRNLSDFVVRNVSVQQKNQSKLQWQHQHVIFVWWWNKQRSKRI